MVFSVINDINAGREVKNPENFDPWITNICYSLFPDTIYHANQMNLNSDLPKDFQLSYYINTIRASKRWRKWPKKIISEDIKLIQEIYGYSENKAKTALALLSKSQIEQLKKKYNKRE